MKKITILLNIETMKKVTLLLIILLFTNFVVAEDLLDIRNVKQGLLTKKTDTSYVVLKYESELIHKPNGSCINIGTGYDKCMWWGITFNHKALTKKYDLPCKVTIINGSNTKTHMVGPKQKYTDDKDVYNISLPVEPNVTETTFPFYATKDPEDKGRVSVTYECSDTNVKGFKTTMVFVLN